MTGPAATNAGGVSFDDLPIGEQLTIWAVRIWARALQDAPTLHRNLHDAFKVAGIPEGYLAFDKVMTILSTTSDQGIAIGCTCCGGITDDEQVLLGLVAEFQGGSAATAHVVLADWLPTAAIRVAAEYISEYALLIKSQGLLVRLRQWRRSDGSEETAFHQIH